MTNLLTSECIIVRRYHSAHAACPGNSIFLRWHQDSRAKARASTGRLESLVAYHGVSRDIIIHLRAIEPFSTSFRMCGLILPYAYFFATISGTQGLPDRGTANVVSDTMRDRFLIISRGIAILFIVVWVLCLARELLYSLNKQILCFANLLAPSS